MYVIITFSSHAGRKESIKIPRRRTHFPSPLPLAVTNRNSIRRIFGESDQQLSNLMSFLLRQLRPTTVSKQDPTNTEQEQRHPSYFRGGNERLTNSRDLIERGRNPIQMRYCACKDDTSLRDRWPGYSIEKQKTHQSQ